MAQALEVDPRNGEVMSTLASVRLSQCRGEEASQLLESSLQTWYQEPDENGAFPDG